VTAIRNSIKKLEEGMSALLSNPSINSRPHDFTMHFPTQNVPGPGFSYVSPNVPKCTRSRQNKESPAVAKDLAFCVDKEDLIVPSQAKLAGEHDGLVFRNAWVRKNENIC
jgi:hypothetical protein